MNKDDIIRMAKEAGCVEDKHYKGEVIFISNDALERFANLIAEANDNKYPIKFTHEEYNAVIEAAIADGVAEGCDVVAKWMMRHEYATGHGDTIKDLLEELEWQIEEQWECAAAAEREAIAKFILSVDLSGIKNDPALQHYTANLLIENAKAIRARGQK